jgi:hypothetical protein
VSFIDVSSNCWSFQTIDPLYRLYLITSYGRNANSDLSKNFFLVATEHTFACTISLRLQCIRSFCRRALRRRRRTHFHKYFWIQSFRAPCKVKVFTAERYSFFSASPKSLHLQKMEQFALEWCLVLFGDMSHFLFSHPQFVSCAAYVISCHQGGRLYYSCKTRVPPVTSRRFIPPGESTSSDCGPGWLKKLRLVAVICWSLVLGALCPACFISCINPSKRRMKEFLIAFSFLVTHDWPFTQAQCLVAKKYHKEQSDGN